MAQTPQPLPQQALYGYDVAPASELFLGTTPETFCRPVECPNSWKSMTTAQDHNVFLGILFIKRINKTQGSRLAKNEGDPLFLFPCLQ